MGRFLSNQLRILLAGLLAILPLVLTIGGTVWVGTLLFQWAGPGSAFGGILARIGLAFVPSPIAAYLIGFLVIVLLFMPSAYWSARKSKVESSPSSGASWSVRR